MRTVGVPGAASRTMRPRWRVAVRAGALLLAVGAGAPPRTVSGQAQRRASPTDVAAVKAMRERSNRSIAAHDVAGIVRSLASNYHAVTSVGAVISSREEARRVFTEQFATRKDLLYERVPEQIDVFAAWGMAAESGHWRGQWSDADGQIRIGGSYFARWQREGDEWRIQAEIFVPDRCEGGRFCRSIPAVPGAARDTSRRP